MDRHTDWHKTGYRKMQVDNSSLKDSPDSHGSKH